VGKNLFDILPTIPPFPFRTSQAAAVVEGAAEPQRPAVARQQPQRHLQAEAAVAEEGETLLADSPRL